MANELGLRLKDELLGMKEKVRIIPGDAYRLSLHPSKVSQGLEVLEAFPNERLTIELSNLIPESTVVLYQNQDDKAVS